MYATWFSVVKNHFDADNASRRTFITAYRKATGFRGGSSFKTRLLSITINQCKDILRDRRRNPVWGRTLDLFDEQCEEVLFELSREGRG